MPKNKIFILVLFQIFIFNQAVFSLAPSSKIPLYNESFTRRMIRTSRNPLSKISIYEEILTASNLEKVRKPIEKEHKRKLPPSILSKVSKRVEETFELKFSESEFENDIEMNDDIDDEASTQEMDVDVSSLTLSPEGMVVDLLSPKLNYKKLMQAMPNYELLKKIVCFWREVEKGVYDKYKIEEEIDRANLSFSLPEIGNEETYFFGDIHGDMNVLLNALRRYINIKPDLKILDKKYMTIVSEDEQVVNDYIDKGVFDEKRYILVPDFEFNQDFDCQIVLLGDLIDRGRFSEECLFFVLHLLEQQTRKKKYNLKVVAGNHDYNLLQALEGLGSGNFGLLYTDRKDSGYKYAFDAYKKAVIDDRIKAVYIVDESVWVSHSFVENIWLKNIKEDLENNKYKNIFYKMYGDGKIEKIIESIDYFFNNEPKREMYTKRETLEGSQFDAFEENIIYREHLRTLSEHINELFKRTALISKHSINTIESYKGIDVFSPVNSIFWANPLNSLYVSFPNLNIQQICGHIAGSTAGRRLFIEKSRYIAGLDNAATHAYSKLKRTRSGNTYQAWVSDPRTVFMNEFGNLRRIGFQDEFLKVFMLGKIDLGNIPLGSSYSKPINLNSFSTEEAIKNSDKKISINEEKLKDMENSNVVSLGNDIKIKINPYQASIAANFESKTDKGFWVISIAESFYKYVKENYPNLEKEVIEVLVKSEFIQFKSKKSGVDTTDFEEFELNTLVYSWVYMNIDKLKKFQEVLLGYSKFLLEGNKEYKYKENIDSYLRVLNYTIKNHSDLRKVLKIKNQLDVSDILNTIKTIKNDVELNDKLNILDLSNFKTLASA